MELPMAWTTTSLMLAGKHSHISVLPDGRVCIHREKASDRVHCIELHNIHNPTCDPLILKGGDLRWHQIEPPPTLNNWWDDSILGPTSAASWSASAGLLAVAQSYSLSISNGTGGRQCLWPLTYPIRDLAWSNNGRYLAGTTADWEGYRITIWDNYNNEGHHPSLCELPSINRIEAEEPLFFEGHWYEDHEEALYPCEWGFCGFTRISFSPDNTILAAIGHTYGEGYDDEIYLFRVPDLAILSVIQASFCASSLGWQADSKHLVYCSDGSAFRYNIETSMCDTLPFDAERCCPHPTEPLCAFFSTPVPDSNGGGGLFIVDLSDGRRLLQTTDAREIVDLCWSSDGSRLYAVSSEGRVWIGHIAV